jgi:RNA ligase (TIGR02306 family)
MRKLASVRKIDAIVAIEGADAIEVAIVGGWKVVVKKNEFAVGDLAVYFEIDSWIPTELVPFLSRGKEPREYYGVKGERLRTVKLRGQLSQGLLMAGTICPTGLMVHRPDSMAHIFQEGDDVSEWLNIQKWEAPVSAQLAGQAKGNFPTVIPKTDQERCQNLVQEINDAVALGLAFEVTEKLEGSSMTCYLIDGEFGVCSRNIDLKETDGNAFWAAARKEGIEEKMRACFTSRDFATKGDFAIQGELIGPGIQGNIYNLKETEFRVFDVYNISGGFYMMPAIRRHLIDAMGLKHVPVLAAEAKLYDTLGIQGVDGLLKFAEGKSVIGLKGCEREGVVFKECSDAITFKCVSNRYLMSEK